MNKKQAIFGVVFGSIIAAGLLQLVDYPWLFDQIVVTFFFTLWLFFGAVKAKGMKDRGELGEFLTWVWSPGLMLVLILDTVFNATWGWLIFKEPPSQLLFTSRVQFNINMGTNLKAARKWAERLNRIDPGHISV